MSQACRECVAKISINISPPSTYGACGIYVSSWWFLLLVNVASSCISLPKCFIFCWHDMGQRSPYVEMLSIVEPALRKITGWRKSLYVLKYCGDEACETMSICLDPTFVAFCVCVFFFLQYAFQGGQISLFMLLFMNSSRIYLTFQPLFITPVYIWLVNVASSSISLPKCFIFYWHDMGQRSPYVEMLSVVEPALRKITGWRKSLYVLKYCGDEACETMSICLDAVCCVLCLLFFFFFCSTRLKEDKFHCSCYCSWTVAVYIWLFNPFSSYP